MKTTMVLFIATMFASLKMAAGVPYQEQYHRAKYGRYTPAYEARLNAEAAAKTPIAMESAIPDCCRSLHRANGGGNPFLTEERNRVKYGRYSPAKEARAQAARVELAAHGRACRVLDNCPPPTDTLPAVAAVTDGDARQLAKYGRVFSAKKAPVAVSEAPQSKPCEHACCQHAE